MKSVRFMKRPQGYALKPDLLLEDLGRRAARGAAVVFGSTFAQKGISLAFTAVLARLLLPRDFGLFGMVVALTSFLQMFTGLGLYHATIQRSTLDHRQVSTYFWIGIVVGAALSLFTAGAAGLIARFYGQPVLRDVVLWASPLFLLNALSEQHRAILSRRMEFTSLAISNAASLLGGGTVAVGLAAAGAGVYALVGQSLAEVVFRIVADWYFAGWIPGWPQRGHGTRRVIVGFSGLLTASHVINHFARNVDKIMLGSVCGASALGLYGMSYRLMTLPLGFVSSPISTVAFTSLSRLQHDLARMRRAYLGMLRLIAAVSFPLMVCLYFAAGDVMLALFGAEWSAAAPILRILCVAGLWQGIYSMTGNIYVVNGRTDRMLLATIVMTAVLCTAYSIGARGGAEGMALAYTIGLSVALPAFLAYGYRTIGLRLTAALRCMFPFLAAAALLMPVPWALARYLPSPMWPLLRAALVMGGGAGAYAVIVRALWPDVFRQLREETFGRVFAATRNRRGVNAAVDGAPSAPATPAARTEHAEA